MRARMPAHDVLARWSQRPGFTLITQNVDGLHERAGTRNVIRYHGSIWRLKCSAALRPAGMGRPDGAARARCRRGARRAARSRGPAVVWFGESIPPGAGGGGDGRHELRRVPLDWHVEPGLSRRRGCCTKPGTRRVDR